jgi:peptide/nickel transport system substrate-binding protein
MSEYRSDYWQAAAARRASRRRLIGGGAAMSGLAALTLAGCGGGTNNSGNNAGTKNTNSAPAATTGAGAPSASATRAAAAASGTPASVTTSNVASTLPTAQAGLKTGGSLQATIVGPAPLDPVENTTYRAQDVSGYHYSRLLRFAASADPNTSLSKIITPDLIEKYEVSPDALQYTMHVRQGVNFHAPLSRALTSADIMSSWEYFTTNVKNANKDVYVPIVDSLTAPDEKTIVFKLKAPYAPFLNKLANPSYMWILSQEAVNRKGIDPSTQAIGTGPFIFQDQSPTAISWKKNPNYWNKGIPYVDSTALNVIPTTSTQEAQFSAGALDVLSIATADWEALKKAVPKANSSEYPPAGLSFLFFYDVNAADSLFKDVRVRQAASLAIDRKGLISAGYNDHGFWCNMVPAGLGKWYLDPNGKDIGDAAKLFKYDPQQAKQLLQAAGAAGTELTFYYPNNAYGDVFNLLADLTRGMLSDAGFKVSAVTVDYLKDWIDPAKGYWVKGLPKNGIGYALQTGFSDPDDYLTGMLTKGGNRNDSLVDDPDLLSLIKAQQLELDETKRVQLVYNATRAANLKMYYVPGTYTTTITMTQPWVQNFWPADSYNFGTESFAFASINK